MSFDIKSCRDLFLVPIHILRNPGLSPETKGAAAVLYSHSDLYCTTVEIAHLLGVSEKHSKELI